MLQKSNKVDDSLSSFKTKRGNMWFRVFFLVCLVAFAFQIEKVEGKEGKEQLVLKLAKTSLQNLVKMTITSVSKREEKFFDAASAIYVITQEDIRRSGATSIMEALRMAPGLEVAQYSHNEWAIASRGFNEIFADKLLVLIDGRVVYSTLFSGVYWDQQDTMLEDIDRIEVIRGPGATIWGSNAVNGVINIITKYSDETQGGVVSGVSGNLERGIGSVRYGGTLDNGIAYRGFAKYTNRNTFEFPDGKEAFDDGEVARAGFRSDWDKSKSDSYALLADYYIGKSGVRGLNNVVSLTPPFTETKDFDSDTTGFNLLGRWKHIFPNQSELSVQAFYDRAYRSATTITSEINTLDLEAQHQFRWRNRHHIVWGAGIRAIIDEYDNSFSIQALPDSREYTNSNLFFQDEIELLKNRLTMTVGSKFELTRFTGFEYEPNVRFTWTPTNTQTIWTAFSRAVRIPNRLDKGGRIRLSVASTGDGTPIDVSVFPDQDETADVLLAYEIGYRIQPTDRLLFDFTSYINEYENLFDTATGSPFFEAEPSPAHLVLPVNVTHAREAEIFGVEAAAQWEPTDYWQLKGSLTWLNINLFPNDDNAEDNDPDVQWNLRSFLDLPYNFEFDTMVYYVGALPNQRVPSYTRLDLRLGWRPSKDLELSLVGQNLQDSRHPESTVGADVSFTAPTETPRGYYGKLTWQF